MMLLGKIRHGEINVYETGLSNKRNPHTAELIPDWQENQQ